MSVEHTHEHQSQPPEDDAFSLENLAHSAKELTLQMGWHAPTLLVAGSKQRIGGQFEHMPPSHEDRVRLMYAAGKNFGEQDVLGSLQQVVFITEAWVSVLSEGEAFRQPSQDPERKEVLCISRLDVATQRHELVLYEIVRDANERIIDLPDYRVGDEETTADSPLLKAFAVGYTSSRAQKFN
ncbi:hypothetical protein ACFLYO_10160 [Chloroflexota bacterium]